MAVATDCATRPDFAGDEYSSDDVADFLNEYNRWARKCEVCCLTMRDWDHSLGVGLKEPGQ